MSITHTRCLAAFAAISVSCVGTADADVLTYIGSTRNWYDPINWDLGRLPGAGDNVVIAGGRSVLIDPAQDPAASSGVGSGGGAGKVSLNDISLTEGATLETLAGTEFTTRNQLVTGGASLIHRSTVSLEVAAGGTATYGGGVLLNPSTQSKRDLVLKGNIVMGLGGIDPASSLPGGVGAGHYATFYCQSADLTDGALDVQLFYGFTPALGQSFQLITVGQTLTGQFTGLGEGSMVRAFGDVGLFISYHAGDGNDVALTAAIVPTPGTAAVLGLGALLAARRRR